MTNTPIDNSVDIENDGNQRDYRKLFNIQEKFLIHYSVDNDSKQGYIVFVDNENDLDYIDKRDRKDWSDDDKKNCSRYIAKLQIAEATPHLNLDEDQIMAFKRKLGGGYILAMERSFEGIDCVIEEALTFLRQRNIEYARTKFLESANLIAVVFVLIGFLLYLNGITIKWFYGVIFGVLGAYTSVWTRYGRMMMTGLATKWLHYLESISRLFIGSVFGVVAMFAIKCGLLFSDISSNLELFAYSLVSFAAGFSERLIPSLIEKVINEKSVINETAYNYNK